MMMRLLTYFQFIFEEETSSAKNVEVAKKPLEKQDLSWNDVVKNELRKAKVDPALAWLEAKTWVVNRSLEQHKIRAPKNFSEMITSSSLEKDFNSEFFHKVDALVLQYTDSALWRILAPAQRNQVKNAILVAVMDLYTNPNRDKSQEWVVNTWEKKEKKSRTDMILDGFSSKNVGKAATITWSLKSFWSSLKPMLEWIGAVGVVKDVVTMTGNITRMFVHAEEAGLILENWALDTKKIPNTSWNNSLVADGRKLAARALSKPDITTKNIITKESNSTYFAELFTNDVAWINTVDLWNKLSTVINASKNPAELKNNIATFVDSAWSKLSGIQSVWKTMLQKFWMSDEMAGTVVDELKKIIPPRASTLLGFIFGNGAGNMITNDVIEEKSNEDLADTKTNAKEVVPSWAKEIDGVEKWKWLLSFDTNDITSAFKWLFGSGKASEFITWLWVNAMRNTLLIAWAENGFTINLDMSNDTNKQTMTGMFCMSSQWWDKAALDKYNANLAKGKEIVWYAENDSISQIEKELCTFIGHMNNGRWNAQELFTTLHVVNVKNLWDLWLKVQWWIYNDKTRENLTKKKISDINDAIVSNLKYDKPYGSEGNVENIV